MCASGWSGDVCTCNALPDCSPCSGCPAPAGPRANQFIRRRAGRWAVVQGMREGVLWAGGMVGRVCMLWGVACLGIRPPALRMCCGRGAAGEKWGQEILWMGVNGGLQVFGPAILVAVRQHLAASGPPAAHRPSSRELRPQLVPTLNCQPSSCRSQLEGGAPLILRSLQVLQRKTPYMLCVWRGANDSSHSPAKITLSHCCHQAITIRLLLKVTS